MIEAKMQRCVVLGTGMVLTGLSIIVVACSGIQPEVSKSSAAPTTKTALGEGMPPSFDPTGAPAEVQRSRRLSELDKMSDRAPSDDQATAIVPEGAPKVSQPRSGEYVMVTVPNGFLQRNAYFTAAEIQDAAYERHFRSDHPQRCERGETFTRRDVRWYEAQRPGAGRCAAVVHIAVCRGEKLDGLATEQARSELVALEPETPIPPHCGSRPAEQDIVPSLPEREASQIVRVTNLTCNAIHIAPRRPLHVWPSTRFGVRTFIDPTLMTDQRVGHLDFVRRAPETILGPAAYRAGERQSQFMQTGTVPEQGTNIVLEQRIAASRSGPGYCISLTARQGGRVWQQSYYRKRGTSPIATETGWRSASPVLRDARALAKELRAALVTTPFSPDK